ncbi:MAG: hypothetical protein ABSE62_00470 [Chthoniobacteraceae bacterium]|jgi:hypothetical protein
MKAVQNRARAILNAIRQRDAGPNAAEAEAAKAFEDDMAPICEAVEGAIRAKDLAAFEGLKGMFGKMLADANAEPALAEVMQREIGAALLEGLAEPAPEQGGTT